MTCRRAVRFYFRFLAATLLAAAPAAATTIVPLSDPVLVDSSSTIVVARVEGRLPRSSDRPVTDWLVTVERALKGAPQETALVVRVPGGDAVDGSRLTLYGAPKFARGERVLLFLERRADGTWGIAQFLQGAFHEIRSGGRGAAVRDLTEVRVLRSSRRRAAAPPRLRDFDAFAHWIEDRAVGVHRERAYFFRPNRSQMQAVTARFTLFEENGLNFRWFSFDNGGSVQWRAHQDGQDGVPGGGFSDFPRALSAWNAEPTTPINLNYGGTTSATAGFDHFDSQNVILFDDPNEDIEGTFDCSEGGTVAIGGPWSDVENTGRFNGRTYIRIQGGDVVFNDGLECVFNASPDAGDLFEEVSSHEIGHTLGLGHSSENENEPSAVLREALMFFQAHDDGRGARLNSDDQRGVQSLYRRSTGPTACAPDTLCLLQNRFQVTATWRNQFDGSSGVAGVQKASDLSGYLYFTDPRNTELIFKILDFGTNIKVFWGQLTNLQYTINVTDTRDGTSKQYSNTPGDCGGFDDVGFPASLASVYRRGLTATIRKASLAGTCRADADTMCLIGNRFAVEMTWRNQFNGTSGSGRPKRLSDLTGAFAFTDPQNLEILIKTLPFPDRVLVLYGALSNLEYTLRVTDTTTGAVKTYSNPAGRYCGGLDNTAFPP